MIKFAVSAVSTEKYYHQGASVHGKLSMQFDAT